jgi:hypothetical protein
LVIVVAVIVVVVVVWSYKKFKSCLSTFIFICAAQFGLSTKGDGARDAQTALQCQ